MMRDGRDKGGPNAPGGLFFPLTEVTMSMEDAVREILSGLGENPDREGLANTPGRVAKSLK